MLMRIGVSLPPGCAPCRDLNSAIAKKSFRARSDATGLIELSRTDIVTQDPLTTQGVKHV
jgi:hypothetical protein